MQRVVIATRRFARSNGRQPGGRLPHRREDADDVGSPLHFGVDTLESIRRSELRATRLWKRHGGNVVAHHQDS